MKQCSNCGFNLADNATFCSNCGKQTTPVRSEMVGDSEYNSQADTKNSGYVFFFIMIILVVACAFSSIAMLRAVVLNNYAKDYEENGVFVLSNEKLYYEHNRNSTSAGNYFKSSWHNVYDTHIDYIKGEIWLKVLAVDDNSTDFYWIIED
ncbi:MAG: zinc-ribbon domain-containing protein [Lachnospirales bacterium]